MNEDNRISLKRLRRQLFVVIFLCSYCTGTAAFLENSPQNDAILNQQLPETEIEITFIANTGFLIDSGEKKILVDALWDTAFSYGVPTEARPLIEQALPPFDDIDLILTTHVHADHHEAVITGTHLMNDPNAILVSTEEVVESLESSFPEFEAVRDRVRVIQPEEGERIQQTLNGIDIEVLNLPHGPEGSVRNNAYLFTLGGAKLFHTGDLVVTFEEVYGYALYTDEIDIAFMPYSFMTYGGEEERILREAISPKRVIPMHIRPNSGRSILEQIDEEYPEALVFYEKMQTIAVSFPLEMIEEQTETGEEEEENGELPEKDEGMCLGTILLVTMLTAGIAFRRKEKNR